MQERYSAYGFDISVKSRSVHFIRTWFSNYACYPNAWPLAYFPCSYNLPFTIAIQSHDPGQAQDCSCGFSMLSYGIEARLPWLHTCLIWSINWLHAFEDELWPATWAAVFLQLEVWPFIIFPCRSSWATPPSSHNLKLVFLLQITNLEPNILHDLRHRGW